MNERGRPDRRLLGVGRQTRIMRWIMAVMLFLTVLAAALGLGTLGAAQSLDRQLAGRLTVQLVEPDAAMRDRDAARLAAALRALPQVAQVRPVPRAELLRLLKPWLGSAGIDPDLPIPALIDVDLRGGSDAGGVAVAQAAHRIAPAARVDRHARWMSPVAAFMRFLILLAAALVLLMAAATATVVVLAVRAGLETHRDTIEVMHMLGSTDVQIARLFQRRTGRDTLVGGAIGAVAALGVTAFVGYQIAALGSGLLGGAALGTAGWLALLLLPFGFAALATVAARLSVTAALAKTL